MKKFLTLAALMMMSSSALMAQAATKTDTKDFTVEAVVDEDVKLERTEGSIIVKVGEEKISDTMTVRATCKAKLSAQADAVLKHSESAKTDTIPFEAVIVKGGIDTQITTDKQENDILDALNNGDQFTIKVKIPALSTSVSAGTYTGTIKLTVSGQ